MEKKITDTKQWFYVALGSLIISLLSLLLPILELDGMGFNIIDLIGGNPLFTKYVITAYNGPVIWNITTGTVIMLGILSVLALICAIVGLITLRAQRPNTINFVLTIAGLIGVLLPSLTAIITVAGYGKYFSGKISLGMAPFISPIAIIIAVLAVIRRKNTVAEKLKKEVEEKGLMREAGDL